jgi:hypothetical protein
MELSFELDLEMVTLLLLESLELSLTLAPLPFFSTFSSPPAVNDVLV